MCCLQRILCSDIRHRLFFLYHENKPGQNPISNVSFLCKYKTRKIPDPSRQTRNALLCTKFSISARVHGMKMKNIKSIIKNLALKQIFWIDCQGRAGPARQPNLRGSHAADLALRCGTAQRGITRFVIVILRCVPPRAQRRIKIKIKNPDKISDFVLLPSPGAARDRNQTQNPLKSIPIL